MNILEKYIKNNRKVEIEIFAQEKNSENYKTGFYKILDDKYIIYRPQHDINLNENQEIKVLIYTNAGIFIFKTNVISFNSKIIEINKPKNYKTIQRRELLRAELSIPFVMKSENKRSRFLTKNISGSGFSFYNDEILDKNKNYEAELAFSDRKISSKIKIIEIRKNLKADLPKYRYSVKLLSLNKIDENYIIKQCIVNNIQTINI